MLKIIFSICLLILPLKTEAIPENIINELLAYAKTFQGTPYKYGGQTPVAFDCSGYVRYVYNHFGYELRQASHGLAFEGFQLPVSDLAAGDLIFFRGNTQPSSPIGHVGIVIESNLHGIKFIHASTSRGVIISELYAEKYWLERVEGGVRI